MIPTYRKLLVTTDLSSLGNAAIPHAYAVLAERGGRGLKPEARTERG